VHCAELWNVLTTRLFLTGKIPIERAGVLKGWLQLDAEKHILEMFPDLSDFRSLSKETGLTPNELFKVFQSRFHSAVSGFLAQVVWPQNYHVDQTALLKIVHRFSFLFCLGIFD
jgi:hypothetical protein